ncbi:MAG: glycosyltransferase, partial [Candidatus Angelobacter sp.]
PDTSAFSHGKWIPQSFPHYDCIFHTKRFLSTDASERISLRNSVFLPHGYSPNIHRIVTLDQRDIADYGCDVSFIASHTRYKEELIGELMALRPGLDLSVWGEGWTERCQNSQLKPFIRGFPLLGESYIRGIQAAKINLAIMSGIVEGASSGDLTTSRTYTIPACGGFMLHERNPEVLELYEEGTEIGCFASAEELAAKIDYYLAHPLERLQIARAGHARCVPAYSYDSRMAEILRWHAKGSASGIDIKPSLVEVS